jgi:uncharacterized protein YjbJ (UPF0337 family)
VINLAKARLESLLPVAAAMRYRIKGQEKKMDRIEGSWKELKGKIKQQWGNLTDDDLDRIAGKREELEGKLQQRYGLTKDAARQQIDDWMMRLR